MKKLQKNGGDNRVVFKATRDLYCDFYLFLIP